MADSAVVDAQQDCTTTDEDKLLKEALVTSVASNILIQIELLCIVVNTIQTMPYEFTSKLCTKTAEDILFETAFPANEDKKPRKIRRRGGGKKQNDLHDILKIGLEMPEALCDVAKDLANLPPLSMTIPMSKNCNYYLLLKNIKKCTQSTILKCYNLFRK